MKRRISNGAMQGVAKPLLAVCISAFSAVFVAVSLACGGGEGSPVPRPTSPSGGLVEATPVVRGTLDLARPTAEAENLTEIGPDDRFVIPSIGVEAPITYRYVEPDGAGGGAMPNPEGPDDVAYYDFSGIPGKGGAPGRGGNAVFAGHVDSGNEACDNGTEPPPCTAVLWDLNTLELGDEIQVHVGGEIFSYAVTSNQPVKATEDFGPIVASTSTETITIITCGGDFNRETGEYDVRQVVTAERTG